MAEKFIEDLEMNMDKCVESYKKEISTIRTGRASPAMLDLVKVDYYGFPTPLIELAQITIPEPRQMVIKPYDPSSLKDIARAITNSTLGLVPNDDGTCIRLNIPALSEERRKEFVKDVKTKGENSKVAMRNIRRDAMDQLKKMEKDSLITEDDLKKYSDDVQKLLDKEIAKVDQEIATKEKLIMEI